MHDTAALVLTVPSYNVTESTDFWTRSTFSLIVLPCCAAGLIGMRITRPCAGDDPFKIEALEQHELLLSDMSLAPPDRSGKCRRLYNRLGALCPNFPYLILLHTETCFGCQLLGMHRALKSLQQICMHCMLHWHQQQCH